MKMLSYLKALLSGLFLLIITFQPTSAQQQKGLLWEISGKGMAQPAYLFGTVHLYDTSVYRLPQAPFDLLKKVDKVYFELDFGKINAQDVMADMFIDDTSQYINKLLPPASLAKLQKLTASSAMMQMMGEKLYAIKPILLLSLLMSNDGKAPSVDLALYQAAMGEKRPVDGLETYREQMDALNTMSIPLQITMLQQLLDKDLSPVEMLNKMTAVYVRQDIQQMLTELNEDMPLDANFNEELIIKRNAVMANRIDSLLRKEHPLIAVGAGHLGNDTGLIALLKQKGYTLKNVPFTIQKVHE